MVFIFDWLGMWGEHVGLFGTNFEAAIFDAANVVVFATALILCLRTLSQLNAERVKRRRSSAEGMRISKGVLRKWSVVFDFSQIGFHSS